MIRGPTEPSRVGRSARRRALALLLALLAAPAANACTLCHTADAREIRHQVLEHGFRENLFSLSMVFPILLGAILLAGRDRTGRNPGNGDEHS